MVTPLKDDPHERLPQEYRDVLVQAGCILKEIDYLLPTSGGYTGAESRFIDTWTKLRGFGLSEYEVRTHNADVLICEICATTDASNIADCTNRLGYASEEEYGRALRYAT
jgi:hypothetical protein